MKNRKRLGELIKETGLVDNNQLNQALADQGQIGGKLGTILIDKCLIDELTFLRVLSEQLGVEAITLQGRTIKEKTLKLIPKELAWKYLVVPVVTGMENGKKTLVLAMADPTDAFAIGVMEKLTGHRIHPVLALDNTIRMILMEFYEKQYGHGDLSVHGPSEPDDCKSEKVLKAKVYEPREGSVFLGASDPVQEAEAGEAARADERQRMRERMHQAESDEAHDRLSLEMQAMLRLLIRKGLVKPEEYTQELQKLKMGAG